MLNTKNIIIIIIVSIITTIICRLTCDYLDSGENMFTRLVKKYKNNYPKKPKRKKYNNEIDSNQNIILINEKRNILITSICAKANIELAAERWTKYVSPHLIKLYNLTDADFLRVSVNSGFGKYYYRWYNRTIRKNVIIGYLELQNNFNSCKWENFIPDDAKSYWSISLDDIRIDNDPLIGITYSVEDRPWDTIYY